MSWAWVYVSGLATPTPTFHAYGRLDGDNATLSRCGLVIFDADGYERLTGMRRDHAQAFARPCRKCFREEPS